MSCDTQTACLRHLIAQQEKMIEALESIASDLNQIKNNSTGGYDFYIMLFTIFMFIVQLMRLIPGRYVAALENRVYDYLRSRRERRNIRLRGQNVHRTRSVDAESSSSLGSDVPLFDIKDKVVYTEDESGIGSAISSARIAVVSRKTNVRQQSGTVQAIVKHDANGRRLTTEQYEMNEIVRLPSVRKVGRSVISVLENACPQGSNAGYDDGTMTTHVLEAETRVTNDGVGSNQLTN